MQERKDKRPYVLEGANIAFRALEESDLEGDWYNWFNDRDVTKYLDHGAFPNTQAAQRRFYRENVISGHDQVIFAIEDIKTRKHIGVASIRHINWISRTGEIAVIIGEKDFRVGSNALEAFYLMVKYAFLKIDLHRLSTITMADNEVSLKYCERIGFKDMGVGRDVCYKNGRYKDCVYADLLREEWLLNEGIKAGSEEGVNERISL